MYDGGNLALVFDEEGSVKQRFFYGVGVDEVLAQEDEQGVSWALTDSQGSVRDVVDENGVLLNHVVYDSFGQVVSESDSGVDFRFGYTGKETDEESGLRYHVGRYVDPFNGRFISEDAIGFDAGDTNLYRYVFNSPTNYTDPTGNFAWLFPLGITAAEALGIGFTGIGAAGILWKIFGGNNSKKPDSFYVPPKNLFNPNNINKPGQGFQIDKSRPLTFPSGNPDLILDKTVFPGFLPGNPDDNHTGSGVSCPATPNFEKPYFDSSSGEFPQPVLEDITNGPHGPERSIETVISRALNDKKAQGRWLSKEAGQKAVANLDTSKMIVGKEYSVPIDQNEGVVIIPTETYPPFPKNTPAREKIIIQSADRAIVILKKTGEIHTFPINADHPAYNKPAPMK